MKAAGKGGLRPGPREGQRGPLGWTLLPQARLKASQAPWIQGYSLEGSVISRACSGPFQTSSNNRDPGPEALLQARPWSWERAGPQGRAGQRKDFLLTTPGASQQPKIPNSPGPSGTSSPGLSLQPSWKKRLGPGLRGGTGTLDLWLKPQTPHAPLPQDPGGTPPSCSPQQCPHAKTPGQNRSTRPCPQGPQNTKASRHGCQPEKGQASPSTGCSLQPGVLGQSLNPLWRATQSGSGCQLCPHAPLGAHSQRGMSRQAV